MGEGGTVDGTFDPTPSADGVGTVELNLGSSPDFGGFVIKAIVTTADGSKLAGRLLKCELTPGCSTLSEAVSLVRVSP
jgi:hypothetical protein